MTERRLNEMTILVLSRSAQLVSVNDTGEAYGYLTAAAQFFRYVASSDKTVPLSDELGILLLLRKLDPSLDIRFNYMDELFPCTFIGRLSLIDAVIEALDETPGAFVTLEPGAGPGAGCDGIACRIICGSIVRDIGCV